MTTVTQSQLVAPQALGNADASIYQVPVNTTAKVGRAVFTNTSGSAVTLNAGITSGVALTSTTTLISGYVLAPGQAYVSPELAGAVLFAGQQLHAYAGTSAVVTVIVSGLTIQ